MSEIAYNEHVLDREYAALSRLNAWVARAEADHDAAVDAYGDESYEAHAAAAVMASMIARRGSVVRQIQGSESELARMQDDPR